MACLPAVKSDERTTGEWVCVVTRSEAGGSARDEMEVLIEVKRDAGSREGLKEMLEKLLREQTVSQHPSIIDLARIVLALGAVGGRTGDYPSARRGPRPESA
jgi:hypothetical protein